MLHCLILTKCWKAWWWNVRTDQFLSFHIWVERGACAYSACLRVATAFPHCTHVWSRTHKACWKWNENVGNRWSLVTKLKVENNKWAISIFSKDAQKPGALEEPMFFAWLWSKFIWWSCWEEIKSADYHHSGFPNLHLRGQEGYWNSFYKWIFMKKIFWSVFTLYPDYSKWH